MKDPVIITGIPRSGKGLISGILNICGLQAGDVDKLFENRQIYQKTSQYLVDNGMDKDGQSIFKPTTNLKIPINWKSDIENILGEAPWMIKSSHAALMWPVWNYAFPNAKYLIVRRRTGDIISSCMNTAYMKANTTQEGWLNMCREYEQRFVEMMNAGLNCKVIWPHRMAYGDYQQIYETLEWLGLEWDTKILEWVDPKFAKIRKK